MFYFGIGFGNGLLLSSKAPFRRRKKKYVPEFNPEFLPECVPEFGLNTDFYCGTNSGMNSGMNFFMSSKLRLRPLRRHLESIKNYIQ